MAFVVEDGTGLADANALISLETFYSFADSRNANVDGYDSSAIQGAIVTASQDYISVYYCFKGELLNPDQGLALPTTEVTINNKIKQATYEAALLSLNGNLFVNPSSIDSNGAILSESGSLSSMGDSVTYQEGTQYTTTKPTPTVDLLLKPFITGGAGFAPAYAIKG